MSLANSNKTAVWLKIIDSKVRKMANRGRNRKDGVTIQSKSKLLEFTFTLDKESPRITKGALFQSSLNLRP